MAWTDQCKIAFKTNADAKLWKQKGRKNKTKVLKELSKESGIPFNTLKYWYYNEDEKSSMKTHTTRQNIDIKKKDMDLPLCYFCGKTKVELNARTKEPVGKTSKYYGLCFGCRRIKQEIEGGNHNANINICPKCEFMFKKRGDNNCE